MPRAKAKLPRQARKLLEEARWEFYWQLEIAGEDDIKGDPNLQKLARLERRLDRYLKANP